MDTLRIEFLIPLATEEKVRSLVYFVLDRGIAHHRINTLVLLIKILFQLIMDSTFEQHGNRF